MNTMKESILKAEITGDPLGRGYTSMTDDQIVASLAAEDRVVLVPVVSAELLAWSAGNGRYMKIKTASEDATKNDDIRSIAFAALMMLERDGTSFDFNIPGREALLDALIAVGTLDATDKAALKSLAERTISRAEELGISPVRLGAVQRARG